MKLLGSAKKDVDSYKNSEKKLKIEIVEIVLAHCNLVKNDYQYTSEVLFSFVPKNQFGQLINTTQNFLLLKFGLQMKLVKNLKLRVMSI